MDADTRHQLKTNELAEALSRLRDWNNPATRNWVLGVAAVVILIAAWYVWSAARTNAAELKWGQFYTLQEGVYSDDEARRAGALDDLRAFISSETGTALGGYARLQLARARYDDGLVKTDQRAAAFQEAAQLLDEILSSAPVAPLEAAAGFARASVHESQAAIDSAARDRQIEAARKLYQHLVDDPRFEGSPFVSRARQRLDTMDTLKDPVTLLPGNPPPPPVATQPTVEVQRVTAEEQQRLMEALQPAQPTTAPAPDTPPAPPPGTNETPAPSADEPDTSPPAGEPAPEPPAEPSGAPGR